MNDREKYIKDLQLQLEKWQAEIQVLKANTQKYKLDKKAELEKRIDELCLKCDKAKERIHHIRESENSGWKEFKTGADQMWSGIKKLFKDTRDEFSKGLEEGKNK